ncbi:MAG TPA: ribosome maturation factor RimM [Candidatus Binatia bacterium]|nr:ribosome maturation factor RimM [Candidatus Binatia bacterium]
MSERLVPLGEIVATHGIDGWLKLKPYNKQTTALTPTREVWLEKNQMRSMHEIAMSRAYKNQFFVKLSGVDRIDDAQEWVGSVLSVAERDLDPLPAGEYYHYQVIGLEVFDTQGERIGVVARTWSTPAGELYIVTGPLKEYLIPAVKEIIEKVDFAAGKMVINPPDGLLDL